jgi:hypothetical protein
VASSQSTSRRRSTGSHITGPVCRDGWPRGGGSGNSARARGSRAGTREDGVPDRRDREASEANPDDTATGRGADRRHVAINGSARAVVRSAPAELGAGSYARWAPRAILQSATPAFPSRRSQAVRKRPHSIVFWTLTTQRILRAMPVPPARAWQLPWAPHQSSHPRCDRNALGQGLADREARAGAMRRTAARGDSGGMVQQFPREEAMITILFYMTVKAGREDDAARVAKEAMASRN